VVTGRILEVAQGVARVELAKALRACARQHGERRCGTPVAAGKWIVIAELDVAGTLEGRR